MNKTLKTALIMKEEVEQQLSEWSDIFGWLKDHVLTKYSSHCYEGDLAIEHGYLVFRGCDIKEAKHYEEMIPLDTILDVRLGSAQPLESSLAPFFGTGSSLPLVVRYVRNGVKQTASFNIFRRHYPIHMLNSNREWYETLKDLTSHTS